MTFVLGRDEGVDAGPSGRIGRYRALDGSEGAPLHLDLDGPHAGLVVGKRGYGKSYTLGVLAEELARPDRIAPVVVDPMGVFASLADGSTSDAVPARVVERPTVRPSTLDPRAWCRLLGLDPESGAGSLVWRAAANIETVDGMIGDVEGSDAPDADVRAAVNHLRLAEAWSVFASDGIGPSDLGGPAVTILDVAGLDAAPMNAVVRGVAATLYDARVTDSLDRFPWLLVDEAHAFFDGVAEPALERLLTRGRAPGVSLVLATQRPGTVPPVAVSQSDLLLAHRLTAESDIEALARARPSYLEGSLQERLPSETGAVTVLDDATETVHAARIRERTTPHGGESPTVRSQQKKS